MLLKGACLATADFLITKYCAICMLLSSVRSLFADQVVQVVDGVNWCNLPTTAFDQEAMLEHFAALVKLERISSGLNFFHLYFKYEKEREPLKPWLYTASAMLCTFTKEIPIQMVAGCELRSSIKKHLQGRLILLL